MSNPVFWEGSSFWYQLEAYDNGRFEKLQASLSRKNIFAQEAHELGVTVRSGNIVPIPDIPILETTTNPESSDDILPTEGPNKCASFKTEEELLSLGSCISAPTSPRSPLDQRIAELEASLALDGASRMAASPRILANLRPELPMQATSLVKESGITRLPSEITKRIVSFIDRRGDVCTLSRVSRRWRDEIMPVLYSTLVLRGWDEIIVCLRSVCSVKNLASYVNDLTIDALYIPKCLEDMFYSTLENALDRTRNMRRLALTFNNDDKKTAPNISWVLSRCRFRLHHFVYSGPDAVAEFLDLQTSIRTLQIPYNCINHQKERMKLPPYVTQLWISLAHNSVTPSLSSGIEHLSHLSYRAESMVPLTQLVRPNIHYLAFDISVWLSTAATLPLSFSAFLPHTLSGLRILRLVGYCVVCETPGPDVDMLGLPFDFLPLPIQLGAAAPIPTQTLPAGEFYNIGRYLAEDNTTEPAAITPPTLLLERGLLAMLSNLPNLQALEVGSFVVRDAGRLRIRPGYGRYWLFQRTRWEEEFVHRVTSEAAKQLVVVSFLACDKPLYCSGFAHIVSPQRWYDYLESVKKQVARDEENSGTTLPGLIAKAGVPRWSGSSSEPDNKCDYRLNSSFVRLTPSRLLDDEVVTNEWVKAGEGGSWIKRVNVRNLSDIWPAGC